MMPYSEINIGDVYSNPLHRGFGALSGLEFVVLEKKEKLIKTQAYSYRSGEIVGKPMWKLASDRMFCESWRMLTARH